MRAARHAIAIAERKLSDLRAEIGMREPTEEEAAKIERLEDEISEAEAYLEDQRDHDRIHWDR